MRSKLSLKLVCCLAVGMAVVFGTISYRGHVAYRRALEETNAAAAERISEIIRRATHYSMLRNARDDLYFNIRSIGLQPGLKRIRIYNPEGRISFSTMGWESGALVDKGGEACYGCHAQSAPLTRLNRPDRMRIFRDASGQRVLGVISAIENEADCSNAVCHAHPASQQVLGVLDVQISMAAADQQADGYLRAELLRDLGGMALLLLLCGGLVFVLVHKPIQPLMKATRRYARGDLAYRIEVRSSDELGELAASFNRMGSELQNAREEVAQWTRTLEARVEEKTAQVQQAVERMAEMERLASLGKLAAAVAHEINNPLAGVLTYAKLLSRAVQREEARAAAAEGAGGAAVITAAKPVSAAELAEQREWLHIIEGETLRCGGLVKNLLTFARQVPMQVTECDVNALLDRCVRLVQHQMQLQNIECDWRPAGKLNMVCDAGRIQQALLAIIVNAVEVMPRGGCLRLNTRAEAGPPPGVVISIGDNGPGIPAEVLPHIFEPFFTTKEEGKSIGMGLSVTYGIVEQHGGHISVSSEPGRGTTFNIWLPVEGARE